LKIIGPFCPLIVETAKVTLEKPVGPINSQLKTGGRIDIFIEDNQGNSISIENKIYASDQPTQIERYFNHNNPRNKVLYLTLDGDEAPKISRGDLLNGKDYWCISYRETILLWLELCVKESAELPILRETIRQYIILLKKLTNQLTDRGMEDEIYELISKNYNAAKLIEANVQRFELKVVRDFLLGLKEQIGAELKDGWTIDVDSNLSQRFSGIEIYWKDWDGIGVRLQGEPKIIGGPSIYGVVAVNSMWDRKEIKMKLSEIDLLQDGFNETAWWPYYKPVNLFNDFEDKLRLLDELRRIQLMDEISAQLISLAKKCQYPLSGISRIGSK
jgi:PD-(D/E)XK nuclease superfamily